MQGLWAAVLTLSGTYSELLDYVIFAQLLFYVLTVAAVFVLRRPAPGRPASIPRVGLSSGAGAVRRRGLGLDGRFVDSEAPLHLAGIADRAERRADLLLDHRSPPGNSISLGPVDGTGARC